MIFFLPNQLIFESLKLSLQVFDEEDQDLKEMSPSPKKRSRSFRVEDELILEKKSNPEKEDLGRSRFLIRLLRKKRELTEN